MWAATTRTSSSLGGLGGEGPEAFNVRRPFTEVDFPMGLASADNLTPNENGDHDGDDGAERNSNHAFESAAGQKTVWGTVAPPPSDPNYVPPPPRDDGWLKDWEQDLRLQELMISEGRGQQDAAAGESAAGDISGAAASASAATATTGGKKKKKGKKITLMSTTARRGA